LEHSSVTRDRAGLGERFIQVRLETLRRTASLSAEDQCVQSMADASPAKWHLAHTSWFFEAVVLAPHSPDYQPFDRRFFHLFNSYYESLGSRHPRPQRGMLTRPDLGQVHAYREHVDAALLRFIASADTDTWASAGPLVELGLHHEQQHQELILTDVLHAFSCNPLLPAYELPGGVTAPAAAPNTMPGWIERAGGLAEIGYPGPGFAFDNETPRHQVLLAPYRIANRLVTCGEYLEFIAAGGYRDPALWLSDGWAAVKAGGWSAPI
jgi:ergothioneine biosynthesis protein EgtB